MTRRTSIAQGVAWSLSSRFAAQVLQFGASIAIARLVAPEAFGLVGMVATVTAFLALFVDGGLGIALVQRRDLAEEQIDGAFVVTVGTGAVVCAALLAAAPLVARFYGPAVLTDITRVGAVAVLITSIGIVPRALLVRDTRLGVLALIDLGAVVVSQGVALALAFAGAGVWALVFSGVAASGLTSALVFGASRWRPRLGSSWRGARPLLGVGLSLLAFNVVNYWARTVDNVLIGAWIGERELGLYLRAYALMMLPMTELTSVLAAAVVPALARVQDDRNAVKVAYLKAIGVVALVSFPAMTGLSLVSRPFVSVLFGPSWADVVPMLQILAGVGALQSIYSPVGWIYTSQGRTGAMFRWGMFATAVTIPALAYGASLGSGVYVARAYLAATLAIFIPAYVYVGRLVGLRLRELWDAVAHSAIATVIMGVAVFGCGAALPVTTPDIARLSVQVLAGVAFYVVACRLTGNRAAQHAADLVAEMRPAWRRWIHPIASALSSRNTSRPLGHDPGQPNPRE